MSDDFEDRVDPVAAAVEGLDPAEQDQFVEELVALLAVEGNWDASVAALWRVANQRLLEDADDRLALASLRLIEATEVEERAETLAADAELWANGSI